MVLAESMPLDRPSRRTAEGGEQFVSHHVEDGDFDFALCWRCHGWRRGPVGRRLCACERPEPVSAAESAKLQALEALRDGLAATYQRRWFRILLPFLEGADKNEGLAAWEGLWPAAREQSARLLAERGL